MPRLTGYFSFHQSPLGVKSPRKNEPMNGKGCNICFFRMPTGGADDEGETNGADIVGWVFVPLLLDILPAVLMGLGALTVRWTDGAITNVLRKRKLVYCSYCVVAPSAFQILRHSRFHTFPHRKYA